MKTVDADPTPVYGTCQVFYNANHNNVTPDVSNVSISSENLGLIHAKGQFISGRNQNRTRK